MKGCSESAAITINFKTKLSPHISPNPLSQLFIATAPIKIVKPTTMKRKSSLVAVLGIKQFYCNPITMWRTFLLIEGNKVHTVTHKKIIVFKGLAHNLLILTGPFFIPGGRL